VRLTIEPYRRSPAFEKAAIAASLLRSIGQVAKRHTILLHEACAMPDHVHLLISFDASRHL